MIFSSDLQNKLDKLFNEVCGNTTFRVRENLTKNYRNNGGKGKILINDENMSKAYAISRMPATFSVISLLVSDLISQGLIEKNKIKSIFDLGSGTGSGYFALKELFDNATIGLFERDQKMIDVFNFLAEKVSSVQKCDIVKDKIEGKADLVLTSYVFNELKDCDRKVFFEKTLSLSNEYVLIIDAGTEKNYINLMNLKDSAIKYGFNVIAPCMCDSCPLKSGDYCDFYVRVPRSSAMRVAKHAINSYEDERFVYLLLSKNKKRPEMKKRIIRRPIIMKGNIQFICCDNDGIKLERFSKSDGEVYKTSKKFDINDLI